MNSMTGFGRAEIKSKIGVLVAELSSVNSRYLEVSVRLPRQYSLLEVPIKQQLTKLISRGKLSLFVALDGSNLIERNTTINRDAAANIYRDLKSIQRELKLSGEISISDLLLIPELTQAPKADPEVDYISAQIEKLLSKAVKEMIAMRQNEGKALADDMKKRLNHMLADLKQVEKRSKNSVELYAEKLKIRVNQLLESSLRDNIRIEEEVAILAERTDISEECVRLKSHIKQYLSTLKEKGSIGKRLNFILQEMNREVNTIGSKGVDFDLSSLVISLKEEIEKLREQVQNVE